MGRYTTVQTFADNNPAMRSIPYDQATGTLPSSSAALPSGPSASLGTENSGSGNSASPDLKSNRVFTERVVNPYGSTAGAGSGEFHVYRAARGREMARLDAIDVAEVEAQSSMAYDTKMRVERDSIERLAAKRRRKRERQRVAKRRATAIGSVLGQSKAKGTGVTTTATGEDQKDFTYTPIYDTEESQTFAGTEGSATAVLGDGDGDAVVAAAAVDDASATSFAATATGPVFRNDGSFLEMMQRSLAAAAASTCTGRTTSSLSDTDDNTTVTTVTTTATEKTTLSAALTC
uniref:Uncharacterized protein n=1 Tax=Corethron hystrix TaxID=216773 RepID=A0A7S1BLJ7_9STRA|mmetsp:Transcript_33087/g.76251  ORF Transcript_33087/g.76251 Transcript_33087/m.76251 type:complete len:290 (+) Transcript_33087:290-1159(+)